MRQSLVEYLDETKLPYERESLAHSIKQPNNILGLEYVISLQRLQSHIQASTIKREKTEYHQTTFNHDHIASATAIRGALFEQAQPDFSSISQFIPSYTLHILEQEYLQGRGPLHWEHFFEHILHSLLTQPSQHLQSIYEMEEGIENRLITMAREAHSFKQLCELIKTKRYTWNRIQRILLHTLTQFTKQDAQLTMLEQGAQYIRLLGYSSVGRELLNSYKKQIPYPLISGVNREQSLSSDIDLKAAYVHALGYRKDVQVKERKKEIDQVPLQL